MKSQPQWRSIQMVVVYMLSNISSTLLFSKDSSYGNERLPSLLFIPEFKLSNACSERFLPPHRLYASFPTETSISSFDWSFLNGVLSDRF